MAALHTPQAYSVLIPACSPDHGLGDSSVAGFRGKDALCVSSKQVRSEASRLHSYLDTDLGYKHFHVYIGLHMCAGRYTCMYMCVKPLPNSWLFYMWPPFMYMYIHTHFRVYTSPHMCADRYTCMYMCKWKILLGYFICGLFYVHVCTHFYVYTSAHMYVGTHACLCMCVKAGGQSQVASPWVLSTSF